MEYSTDLSDALSLSVASAMASALTGGIMRIYSSAYNPDAVQIPLAEFLIPALESVSDTPRAYFQIPGQIAFTPTETATASHFMLESENGHRIWGEVNQEAARVANTSFQSGVENALTDFKFFTSFDVDDDGYRPAINDTCRYSIASSVANTMYNALNGGQLTLSDSVQFPVSVSNNVALSVASSFAFIITPLDVYIDESGTVENFELAVDDCWIKLTVGVEGSGADVIVYDQNLTSGETVTINSLSFSAVEFAL